MSDSKKKTVKAAAKKPAKRNQKSKGGVISEYNFERQQQRKRQEAWNREITQQLGKNAVSSSIRGLPWDIIQASDKRKQHDKESEYRKRIKNDPNRRLLIS